MNRARTSPHRPPSHRLAAAGAVLAAVAACSPEPPPPVTPTIAVAETRTQAPPPEPETEAVAEPEGLIGVLRMGSPVRELAAWRDLLPAHTVFGQLASHGAATVATAVLGSLGEHVDVGAPFDMAVLEQDEEGGPPMIGSVVLRDAGEAQRKAAADFEFVPLPDGSVAVKPRPGAENAGLVAKFDLACAILRGGAPRADHLVCAASRERLEQAGPYLARTVALTPAAEGLHLDVSEAAFGRALASLPGAGEDGDDAADDALEPGRAAGRRMARDLVAQFAGDFSKVAVDAHAGTSGVVLGVDVRFRSLRSPLSVAIVGTRGQGVPDTFWKVPADADLALYFPGAPPDTMRGAFGPIWTQLGEILPADDGVPRETWRAVASKMKDLFFTGGPLLVAHGPAAAPAGPAKTPPRAADPKKQHQAARAAAAGWVLFGAPEPITKWATGLQDLVTLDGMSSKKKTGGAAGSAGAKGGAGAAKKKRSDRVHTKSEVLKIGASEKLPAGSLHFVFRTTPAPGYTAAAGGEPPLEAGYEEHVFVAGSEEHTWIAVSENEALARAKVREALAPDGRGLAGRAELAPIRSLPPGGAGFVTLRGVLALDDDADTPAQIARSQAEQQALAALPSAGLAPMFVSSSPAQEGEGASLRIGGALSIAAALDLIRWIQQ